MVTKRSIHTRSSVTVQRRVFKRGQTANMRTPDKHVKNQGGVRLPAPNNGGILLTRRRFLYGALGVGALAAAGGGAAAVINMQKDDREEMMVLTVPENAVTSSNDCTELQDSSVCLGLIGRFTLPYGTLVWANDNSVAACLLPTEQSKPLTQIGLLFLGSGDCPTVVSQAVGQNDGFEIYDVRACSTGLVWTEADILDGVWRVYSANFDGTTVGDPILLEEQSSEWETPTLAAVDGYAFWQVLPRANGNARNENSLLKRATFGTSDTEVVYTSHGRMSTPPYALTDSVVITPRTNTSSVRHQLTRIDARTGSVLDAMVLPSSMKPLEAGFGNSGFMFSFDAIYNFGDGIANLGTYTPKTPVTATGVDGIGNAAYNDVPWFRFSRTPTAAPAWCGNWLMVKSTRAVCGVDLEANTYFALEVPSGTDDYGDYLASSGMGSSVVTYSNIDYQPVDDEAQRYCLVRVWAPVS